MKSGKNKSIADTPYNEVKDTEWTTSTRLCCHFCRCLCVVLHIKSNPKLKQVTLDQSYSEKAGNNAFPSRNYLQVHQCAETSGSDSFHSEYPFWIQPCLHQLTTPLKIVQTTLKKLFKAKPYCSNFKTINFLHEIKNPVSWNFSTGSTDFYIEKEANRSRQKLLITKVADSKQFSTLTCAFKSAYPRHRSSNRAFHAGSIYIDAYRRDLITIEIRRLGEKWKVFQLKFENFPARFDSSLLNRRKYLDYSVIFHEYS